ncbi:hypothetical protein PF002_g3332 [Phytophthora fragariae]|uniref:Uncharacterized protein n=1 Tax=Phytophthora fragariae TaxID=53985 RepID=A0A6A4A786_9STRA|nr:hypothetical protein PF002_g3332 [Phytophthora fragariae]
MVEHIQLTRRVLDELQEHHVEVGDEEKRQNFMHSLGPAWNGFIGVLEASTPLVRNGEDVCVLQEVLFVHRLARNLVSVAAATKNGI